MRNGFSSNPPFLHTIVLAKGGLGVNAVDKGGSGLHSDLGSRRREDFVASTELERFLENFSESMMDEHDSLEEVRAKMMRIHPTDHAPETTVERLEIAGVECAWISTPATDPARTVFFVHGGAFVSTGITQYMTYGQTVADFCHARVLVPAYSLAPEKVFPSQLDELLAVYDAAGLDPARTALMGDSCGGGMALALLCRLRDRGGALPACFAGLTPWLDARQEGESAKNHQGIDPFVNGPWIRARFRDYAGAASLDDPGISPLHAELAGLPPLYLGVGTIDSVRDDATRLASRAAAAGVQILLDVNADHVHGLHGLTGVCPESDQAMDRVGHFVRTYIPEA